MAYETTHHPYIKNWTHRLYKEKHTKDNVLKLHHPYSTVFLAKNTATDAMKVCLCCEYTRHEDSIHIYVHCSNEHLQMIWNSSNKDIATVLRYICALFHCVSFSYNLGHDPFHIFLRNSFIGTITTPSTISLVKINNSRYNLVNTRRWNLDNIVVSHPTSTNGISFDQQ